jgi:thymidylate synthase
MEFEFNTAEEAFENLYDYILNNGNEKENTKFINNACILIKNPEENLIKTKWRKWSLEYAEFEWQWYKSGNRSISEIGKKAKIWNTISDENGLVNSNYGYQWSRNNQIDYAIEELLKNENSRRSCITIYDAKENLIFKKDTPCTLNICFNIYDNKLNMSVIMRSNDLVFGFCNDQYCFSLLQQEVLKKLNDKNNKYLLGSYSHIALDLHIYNRHFNLKQ